MHKSPFSRLFAWSLLVVPLACNSAAESQALNDSTAKADPSYLVDVRKSVEYLASDELEGRGIGTAGIDKAADYIADAFGKLSLQPAPGFDGYFQNFTITAATAPDASTALTSGDKVYALQKDFTVVGMTGEAKFDAPIVFVGYGITSKEHEYDDYAGIDVKGKIALAIRYEPHDPEGISRFTKEKDNWSDNSPLMRKAKLAAEHGAVALLLVNPPTYHEGDEEIPFARDRMSERSPIPFVQVKRHVADELLKKGKAKSLVELQAEIDGFTTPRSQPLEGVAISGLVKVLRTDMKVRNVVGIVRGKGKLADEYVVIGAHYDHLGRGGPGSLAISKKEIHNGADDNASGTAAMMKMAEHYAKAGTGGRSIIFAAFTAEESGLIGSDRFVDHPPVPLDKIAYMLNLDMVGRVRNNVLSIGGGGTAASFDALLKKADEASPLELKTFSKGGYGPSDHMSFAIKKIPVIFFWTGNHSDYHRPSDDADKINYKGLEDVVAVGVNVVDGFATAPREQYVSAADAHSGFSPGSSSGSGPYGGVTLGIIPDYGADEIKGVKISGTTEGTPAAAAGLQAGDIIIKWNDEPLESLQGMSDMLRKSKVGDKVKLVIIRDGKNIEIETTLAARKG